MPRKLTFLDYQYATIIGQVSAQTWKFPTKNALQRLTIGNFWGLSRELTET